MERAVYFDAWYPRQHCYHPSLPTRKLRMVDDLAAYRATSLVWSALGGGSISLPFLEAEAWGDIDARSRIYGFMNDAEYIAECQKRGIKVFGIVFEVQGWEFPVELNEGEDTILAMNELRGAGKRGWIGLREFSQDRYPKLWKSFREYFPNGLVNSAGEQVTDILEECVSRDIHGEALHSDWVEVPGLPQYCYLMDRNNPVWREYLKAIIRIQVDAGVAGVELDEADLPLFSTRYGGCFCRDCMIQFRDHLRGLPADARPTELDGIDLDTFHYGAWLLGQGYDFKTDRQATPLYWEYIRFQRAAVTRHFIELAEYIREYGRSKGREVLVACNCGDAPPHFDAFRPHVDLLCAEQHVTRYRQPSWCRYAAGFQGDKDLAVVEQPFDGVIPELVDALRQGRGHDRLRMMQYEAAALGVSPCIPYGSWMGPVVEDSFWGPHDVLVPMQAFLADHEALYSKRSLNEIAVVYSVPSAFEDAKASAIREFAAFFGACDALIASMQPYDVLMFPEGELRGDSLAIEDLAQYRTLVLPSCSVLTDAQADLVRGFLMQGRRVLVTGELGINLPDAERRSLLDHPGLSRVDEVRPADLADGPQIEIAGSHDLALNIVKVARGAAIHVIRYDYDEERDLVPVLPELVMRVRLPGPWSTASAHSPSREATAELEPEPDAAGHRTLRLRNVPLYTIVLLEA